MTPSFYQILEGILQNMLRECGGSSAFIAKLSEVYVVCPALLPQPHTRLTFTVMLMNCVASFPTPTKTEVCGEPKRKVVCIENEKEEGIEGERKKEEKLEIDGC